MPHRLHVCALTVVLATAAPLRANVQAVNFPAGEITLHADFYPAPQAAVPAPVVVVLHRGQADRSHSASLGTALQDAGLAALALDLRGHGDSAGPPDKRLAERAASGDKRLFRSMHRDVAGAMTWLAGREDVDLARIAMVGVEAGGAVALNYASRDRSVDAVAMLAAHPDRFGLDSIADIERYAGRPVLLLFGDAGSQAQGQDLADAAEAATIRACQVPDGTAIESASTCARVVVEFVASAVGERSEELVCASLKSEVYHPLGSKGAQRIKPDNRRMFSSPQEAEQRGLRASKQSQSQSGTDDG